jgi:hypothetical protein
VANWYCAMCHDLRQSKMDDADFIYLYQICFKIQLSCHMAKINWATWINLIPLNMDDWDNIQFIEKWLFIYLISIFKMHYWCHVAIRVGYHFSCNFQQIVTSCICIITGWRCVCWPYVSPMDYDDRRNDVIICDCMLDVTSLMQLIFF